MSSELEPTPSLSEPDDDGIVNAVVVSMKRALMNEKVRGLPLPLAAQTALKFGARCRSVLRRPRRSCSHLKPKLWQNWLSV